MLSNIFNTYLRFHFSQGTRLHDKSNIKLKRSSPTVFHYKQILMYLEEGAIKVQCEKRGALSFWYVLSFANIRKQAYCKWLFLFFETKLFGRLKYYHIEWVKYVLPNTPNTKFSAHSKLKHYLCVT